MILTFFRKKELKIRQDILRGVLEENRLILGRGRTARWRKRPFSLTRVLLLVAGIAVILLPGRNVDTSFSPTRMPRSSISADPRTVAEGGANTSEISVLENIRELPLSRALGLKIKTIMIDPGHGGTESGCIGQMGTKEKDVTLDIAKRLKTRLAAKGRYRLLMTREDDSSVPLNRRVALAREARADVFISIHVNSVPVKGMNIIETYYFGPSADQKTIRLAEQENAGSEYGLSDFKKLMEKLGTTMKLQESQELARSIQANLFLNSQKHREDIQSHGVKRAPFVVLLGPEVPSVLAEVSCLSHPKEEQELNTDRHKENVAAYLAGGIFDYLNKGGLTYEARQ